MEIKHQPWIGSNYGSAASGVRLLVLGESHHSDDPESIDTQSIVQEWTDGYTDRSYAFFTKLAIALTGKEPHELDRTEAFSQVAFYNYVQRVLDGSRKSPEEEDFKASEPAFRAILQVLRPTHIIACGQRLWKRMPKFDRPSPNGIKLEFQTRTFDVGRYVVPGAEPVAMAINHPQSGFDGRSWHRGIQFFLSNDLPI